MSESLAPICSEFRNLFIKSLAHSRREAIEQRSVASLCHNLFPGMDIYYTISRSQLPAPSQISDSTWRKLYQRVCWCLWYSSPTDPNSLSRSGLHPPPNVCNLCFKMLPSLAALESHLQSEHAKETAPGHGHGHAPASTVAAAAAAAAALRPHASEAGSPYGAKVSFY